MKKFSLPIVVICLLTTAYLNAQVTNNLQLPTSVNTDGSAPNASAILDVQSTDKGMLVPRMTSAQRTAIATPATGLLVFDTDTGGFWFYNGTSWTNLSAGGGGGTPASITDADNDTKVQTEASPDEDIIRFEAGGNTRLQINKDSTVFNGLVRTTGKFVSGDGFSLATGNFSFVGGGYGSIASGLGSFAGGVSNKASGLYSFAAGGQVNNASNNFSATVGGSFNNASGFSSAIAGGFTNNASGSGSFIGGGTDLLAKSNYEAVFGRYNLDYTPNNTSTDRLFVIGNGTSSNNRFNAMTVLKNNNIGIGTPSPNIRLQVEGGTDVAPASGGFIQAGASNNLNIAIDDNEIMARNNGATAALSLNAEGGDVLINGTNAVGKVGIGTNSPNVSAMLDVQSTTKGMLVPRMTTAQRTAIASPATGLLVFDTTTGGFWFYNGSAWKNLNAGTPSLIADTDNDTRILTEPNPDEDRIRMYLAGSYRMLFRKNNSANGLTMIELLNNGDNTFLGLNAGLAATTGLQNTFVGSSAGVKATTGNENTIIGSFAGIKTTTGSYNTFIGQGAGNVNVAGSSNTFIGKEAGYSCTGSNNVFLGFNAGFSETGSNRLYIDNSSTTSPLIWGDFANNLLNFNGKVGIGTTNPGAKLSISPGVMEQKISLWANSSNDYGFGISGNQLNYHVLSTADRHVFYAGGKNGNGAELMRIQGNGQVGIGTDDMANNNIATGYLLSVNGKIAAEEVMVDISSGWPDYVFQEDYKLKSLSEVKQFIDENGHLPGVPSAKDVEENGVILGEMNKILMEKIEELTLYAIEKDKEMAALQNELKKQKTEWSAQMAKLEAMLTKVENNFPNQQK